MYCSSCGTVVMPGLSYCNHCGAKLSGVKDDSLTKSSEVRPETLVWGMVAVFVFGLGAIMGLMAVMKSVFALPDNIGLVIFFTLISFLIMLGVEGVFMWMLLNRKKGAKETRDTNRFEEQAAKALGEAKVGVLAEPASSVTEHTTRSLEPVVLKPKAE